jgi:hypothetical protein
VVTRFCPFHCTTDPGTKPVPAISSCVGASPAIAVGGVTEVRVGTGFWIESGSALEVPPAGGGLNTEKLTTRAVIRSSAVRLVVMRVLETNEVPGRSTPFKRTTELGTKFVPSRVTTRVAAPAVALAGVNVLSDGTGFGALMVTENGLETPPPGAGVETVTATVAAAATSEAAMLAVRSVLLVKVVVRGAPFHRMTEAGMNPDPFTVSVNAVLPAVTNAGERLLMLGRKLLIAKTTGLEVPFGSATVMLMVAAVNRSLVGTRTESCVELTKVVGRSAPFHRTTELELKLSPFTTSVNDDVPIKTLAGDKELTTGTAVTLRVAALDTPPPGVGLKTVMLNVPAFATSAAEILAVSCVPLTKVVVRSAPFQRTIDPLTNPVPFTVKVKAAAPRERIDGEIVDIVGAGLGVTTG